MNRPDRPDLCQRDERVLALCDEHLSREEALLAGMLDVLRQVRAAFLERQLNSLVALQARQEQLAALSLELTCGRDRLRESLAPLIKVSPCEVTLRAAALSVAEPARAQLLERRARLVEIVREADQLNHHNAALLGYASSFLRGLFASLTGTNVSEGYGPQGERREALCGSFLEARV